MLKKFLSLIIMLLFVVPASAEDDKSGDIELKGPYSYRYGELILTPNRDFIGLEVEPEVLAGADEAELSDILDIPTTIKLRPLSYASNRLFIQGGLYLRGRAFSARSELQGRFDPGISAGFNFIVGDKHGDDLEDLPYFSVELSIGAAYVYAFIIDKDAETGEETETRGTELRIELDLKVRTSVLALVRVKEFLELKNGSKMPLVQGLLSDIEPQLKVLALGTTPIVNLGVTVFIYTDYIWIDKEDGLVLTFSVGGRVEQYAAQEDTAAGPAVRVGVNEVFSLTAAAGGSSEGQTWGLANLSVSF